MFVQFCRFALISLLLALFSSAHATTFKIATLSPDGSNWMKELRAGADEIKQRSDGRVKFKFYPGGVMGDDKAVLRKMRAGQLQGAAFTNGSLNRHFPDVQLYNLILKFRSLDEVDYVRDKMDPQIIQGLEENGLVTFGFSEIGFAYLMAKSPIRTVDDLRRGKVWIPEGNNVAAQAVEAFSVTPIPLPIRDVLVALQTNMIDTVAGSGTGAIALQWHSQIKYLTELPLSYIYGVLALDQRKFKRLSEQDQQLVREVMGRVTKKLDQRNREDNIAAMAAIKNQGVEFIQPTPEAIAELERLIDPANERLMATGKLSAKGVAELEQHLADYRAQAGQ